MGCSESRDKYEIAEGAADNGGQIVDVNNAKGGNKVSPEKQVEWAY